MMRAAASASRASARRWCPALHVTSQAATSAWHAPLAVGVVATSAGLDSTPHARALPALRLVRPALSPLSKPPPSCTYQGFLHMMCTAVGPDKMPTYDICTCQAAACAAAWSASHSGGVRRCRNAPQRLHSSSCSSSLASSLLSALSAAVARLISAACDSEVRLKDETRIRYWLVFCCPRLPAF